MDGIKGGWRIERKEDEGMDRKRKWKEGSEKKGEWKDGG